jgi:hypothetical protein
MNARPIPTTDDQGDTYLPIDVMPTKYPHFCETQCTAWNKFNHYCYKRVMSDTHCQRSVFSIEQRIRDWSKMNGVNWWKKKVVMGQTEVNADIED